ncbi:Crp/Fnr family transcriptional regulator [Thermohalobacter berrensis]|uniref:Crp/Fnr family transcriptional regulator n=1 Tax=Thermohalobacter berrensis TaxID=99594 RepID=A0A419T5Y2_9FIRM|nr:Crp/Fnr family transcriptional regulator [Thermohalobacter berrensis]RKD32950.1 hypothetical protein BET03_10060 [Thermohalobacter berrensis]
MDNTYKLLKNIETLKNVKDEIIREMATKCIVREYKSEETIFLEGDLVEIIYLISKGKAMVSRFSEEGGEKIIHIFDKGHFINEVSIDGRKTSTSVTIMEDSQLIHFKKKDILSWMEKDFNFNLAIIKSISNKLRSSYRQIRNLGLKKINSRIAARLCKLVRDYGYKGEGLISIELNLTQSQLAAMVGSTRESVSRFLKHLEREGIIEQKNQKISILNFEGLKEYT